MANRRHNPRRAKSHFSYKMNEAAVINGVDCQTVRNWLSRAPNPTTKARQ
jgi:hypothetical protein